MENAIEDVKVPFKVDVALGKSWGQAKRIKRLVDIILMERRCTFFMKENINLPS